MLSKSYINTKEGKLFFSALSLGVFSGVFGFIYMPVIWAVSNLATVAGILVVLFFEVRSFLQARYESEHIGSRYEGVIRNLHDAVIVYDKEFRILGLNPAAEKIFNIRRDELVGRVVSPDQINQDKYKLLVQTIFPSLAPFVRKISEAGVYPQVADVVFKDRSLAIRVFTSPLSYGGEDMGFVKVISDRTREVEIKNSESEFVSTAAHQLRTPITTTIWALEILNKELSLSDEGKAAAEEGLLASKKLSKVVNDLLDVSKIEEGEFGYSFENADLIPFVEGVLQSFKVRLAQLEGKVSLYYNRGSETSIPISFDRNKLAIVLNNILDNALRYNVPKGSITVNIKRLSDKPYVLISVEDTGIGIDEPDLSKVSSKFFRAENALKVQAEGSGLGLYIAKNIVKRHGGLMKVESVLDRGTKVSFTLPTDPKLVPTREFVYED